MKVSPELQDLFRHRGRVTHVSKSHSLLHQGEVSRHAYLVESGCLRLWYNDGESDISLKFFLPGELCASLDSFHTELPSRYGIDAVVPSVVRISDKPSLLEFKNQSAEFRDYLESVMVHCMADYQNLFADRISKSPQERYAALIQEDPEILNIVPLHHIASYLGITPVSLSRIRRKIAPA